MNNDKIYINRCIQLARLAKGNTLSNPMVGSVIVHNDTIIGEGYHTGYGNKHAEVEALQSVAPANRKLLPESTLYVNLEPCCIYGKTPPCTEAIIQHRIKRVVIAQKDPNPKINGKGIDKLVAQGIEVTHGICSSQAADLNKSFIKNMTHNLPYIILKYAMSKDGYIGKKNERIQISNSWSQYIVHKIRHEVDAIMIGTNTAIVDNPLLSNRLYYGKNPIRIVLDKTGRIPISHHIFNGSIKTILVTNRDGNHYSNTIQLMSYPDDLKMLLYELYKIGISSVLIEGGASLLQNCLTELCWDELWVTTGNDYLYEGIKAPMVPTKPCFKMNLGDDTLEIFSNKAR